MPTQNIIPVTPGSGLDLDAVSLTIGPNTVYRETMVIADPSNATYLATVTSGGALNVAEAALDACITANVLAVSLPAGQITTLTPPTAAAIGTAVSTDLLIGTQLAAASVPVALPTATITALTPPTAAAIAAAIVANPPTVAVSGTVGVTQSTTPWIVAGGGTAGTAATGVLTVQGIAAMTPLLVTATFAAPQHVIVDSGTLTTVSTVTAVTSITNPVAVTGTFFQATQPVSIASGQVASGAFASGSIASGAIASGAASTSGGGAFPDGSVFVRSNAASTFPVTAIGTLTNNNAAPAATEVGVLPALANAVSPLWTEGDQVLESVDLHGGQRMMGGNVPEITAAWTSATGANTTLVLTPILGYGTVLVTIQTTSTITAGQMIFEASDTAAGTNWYPVTGINQGANPGTVVTGSFVLVANSLTAYQINVTGYAAFRVRLSVAITGTGTANVGVQASSVPNPTSTIIVGPVNVRSVIGATTQPDNQTQVSSFTNSNNSFGSLSVADSIYGGAFSGTPDAARQGWSKMHAATVFKTASVAATTTGNSAVWTPATGNKFRLLAFQITAQGLAATTTGVVTVSFQDGASGITFGTYDVDVPAVAGVTSGVDQISGWVAMGGFGILSATANNVLNFNISAAGAGTVGTYRINVSGTEE